MELHPLDGHVAMSQAHQQAIFGLGDDLQTVGHRVAFDDERVVAGRREGIRQTGIDAGTVMARVSGRARGILT